MSGTRESKPHLLRGRFLPLLGISLAVLGLGAYAAQISLGRLMLPWYMPALALLGVALVILSLVERRTVWRRDRPSCVCGSHLRKIRRFSTNCACQVTPGRSWWGRRCRRLRQGEPAARRSPSATWWVIRTRCSSSFGAGGDPSA